MSSFVGNVAYVKFLRGENKGSAEYRELVNDPWQLGEARPEYTSMNVVSESLTVNKLMWTPCVAGGFFNAVGAEFDAKVFHEDGTEEFVYIGVDAATDTWKLFTDSTHTTEYVVVAGDKVAYRYDNVVIPQKKIPTLIAEMDNIPLQARARRIAIRYSQIAAFQAKTDYGMDMAGELARQAVAELNYEVDTEVCNMLVQAGLSASGDDPVAELVWSKTLPVGVSKMEHYAGFGEIVERAKVLLYNRTKKHMPNTMLMAADCLPILQMVPGFKAASVNDISGPFFAGTLNGIKCYVTPNIEEGLFVLIVNKGAMEATAGVYAPYMPKLLWAI